jgi:hypothetical protein
VSEARPIKANHAVVPGKKVYEATNYEILHHRAIAMEEHNARGGGIPSFDVVEAHTVALEELANRRVPSFRQKRERYVADHHDHQHRAYQD